MRVFFLMLLMTLIKTSLADPRSGLDYSSEEIRKLQTSDAENPGMLWVDQGAKLWAQHCASCHGDASSMKGVATRYPRRVDGKVVSLESKIRQKVPQFAYESDELLGLTAFVAFQSRGMQFERNVSEVQKGEA